VNQECNKKKTVLFLPKIQNPPEKCHFIHLFGFLPIIGLYNKHDQKFFYKNMWFSILSCNFSLDNKNKTKQSLDLTYYGPFLGEKLYIGKYFQ